jgi:eukaryotic-like serine/threonine-protein kinase
MSAPAGAGELPPQLVESGAQRLAVVGVALAGSVVALQVFQRLAQPQIAPIIDDPINRLCSLAAVLMGGGLFALQRYKVVTPRTLLRFGRVFELVVAFSIAMVETSRPFSIGMPLLGLSAIGPWIAFLGGVIPTPPTVRLALALGAATTWPFAYAINAARFGFVTESWPQTSIWPVMNYFFAVLAYLVGRWTYGIVREAETAQDLGSYRLISPIGEGGMGEVWRASHKMLARPAAIKLVKPDSVRQDLLARRFQREANAIAGLQSPHTVYLYDFGTTREGRLYYVMELLDGISLQTLVTKFGVQPASRVVAILRQICRSLEEAHENKIVHRDMKPSNVMICKVAQAYDFVKVLDFGLAKPFDNPAAAQLTVMGMTTGTPEFMSPEVAAASSKIDPRADLYAVGCVGYFLLTGSLVFTDANPVNIALKHMKTAPIPPSRRTDQFIPPDVERVILACLEKQPGARPTDARALEKMLAACDVPPWTEADAGDWWARHLPPTSPMRSFAQSPPHTRSTV